MPAQPSLDLHRFLDEAMGFVQAAEDENRSLAAQLKRAADDQDRIVLEKVAEARQTTFQPGALSGAFAKMVNLGILKKEAAQELTARVQGDPGFILPLMLKMAERLSRSPEEGQGVSDEARGPGGRDIDGWDDMVEGKIPKLKK
jgi:hypothetical protein